MTAKKSVQPAIQSTDALARHLGLSRWTVSRVLNNHPGVRAETRQRVQDAMLQLGFEPNMMARGLRGTRTMMIGVCFQELDSPVLARKTAMLQQLLRKEGYRAIIELTGGDPLLEEAVIRNFLSIKVDGIVLVGSTLQTRQPIVRQLHAVPTPVVTVDPCSDLPMTQIHLDRIWAMKMIIDHLHELGHRRFALLGFGSDRQYGHLRLRGIGEALQSRGLNVEHAATELHLPGRELQDYNYGYHLGELYLALPQPPSAVIGLNDRIAIGAMKAIVEGGLQVPGNVSIVGFDNLDVTAWTSPTVTTIDQQVELLMSTAASVLLQQIRDPETEKRQSQLIRPVLKNRMSTGPAPTNGKTAAH